MEDYEVPAEVARLVKHEEKEIHPHKEPIEVINLDSDEVRRHVRSELIKLIREYVDVFS